MREKLRLLNPRNLEKEVHRYGYHWSWKSHVLLTLAALIGIGAVGVVFQLRMGYMMIMMTAMILILPVQVLDVFLKMFEQRRFSDALTYMEQVLYSFQKSGKVLIALKETLELFEEGQMHRVIQEAVWYIERGCARTEEGILREALNIIEESYECNKIHMVHELLINTETYGGETEQSIFLLLEDLELFKRRGYKLQKDKKNSHRDNIISIIVAAVLCAVALYVLDTMKGLFVTVKAPFEIFQVTVIQCSSLLFILFSLFVFAKSTKSLTRDWLKEDGGKETKYLLESYEMIEDYDEKKAKRKSLFWAVLPLTAAIVLFFLQMKMAGVICLVIACFLLMQHKIGYALAKRDVTEALYIAFPQWLMEIALLLQSNNVQVSIGKSIERAPAVLKPELEKLVDRLQKAPDKLTSYTDFCKDFDIPEASSCMKMLHAVSEAGTGNAKIQIHELMKRVNEMQGMADEIKSKNSAFQMKMIFSYPVFTATIKLMTDLTIGMLYMFRMLGNMGGAL